MRTQSEISKSIKDAFMQNPDLANSYGFQVGADFDNTFSAVSIERLLIGLVASAAYILEFLFAEHKKEVSEQIANQKVHRPLWYRNKALDFMLDCYLAPNSDTYDVSGMTESEVAQAKIIKYASVSEESSTNILTIKIAGETSGQLAPVGSSEFEKFKAYISRIKDAGVLINFINQEADKLYAEIDVWYNPLMGEGAVKTACEDAINGYLSDLPFNGEYSNMALIDRLQSVEGVQIAELAKNSQAQAFGESSKTTIKGRYLPKSGYLSIAELTFNMHEYNEQV